MTDFSPDAHFPLTIHLANSGRKWIGEIAHVAILYERLDALGHRPWIICRRESALHHHAQTHAWRHLALTFSGSFSLLSDTADLRAWRALARREPPAIVHCHRGKDHWGGLFIARQAGCPLIRTRHVVMPVRRHPLNRWFYLRATRAIISVSAAARASLGPWADRHPFERIILAAVDLGRFHPGLRLRAPLRGRGAPGAEAAPLDPVRDSPLDQIWFGLLGRFQGVKGHKFFLQAAARVAAHCPAARFMLAGQGSAGQLAKFRALAAELGIADRVWITGILEDLPRVLASLDVGVIASVGSEGSSRAALEMMASGLPLVATRVGGIPDLVPSEAFGRLVPPRDPEALAAAMLAWAADPEARAFAGRLARDHVERHHSPERWIAETLAVYRLARGEPPDRP